MCWEVKHWVRVCVCVWASSAGVCLSLISLLREYWGLAVSLPVNSVLMLSLLHWADGCADFRGLAEAAFGCPNVLLIHSCILRNREGWIFYSRFIVASWILLTGIPRKSSHLADGFIYKTQTYRQLFLTIAYPLKDPTAMWKKTLGLFLWTCFLLCFSFYVLSANKNSIFMLNLWEMLSLVHSFPNETKWWF